MWAIERSGRAPRVLNDIDRTMIDTHVGAERALAAIAQEIGWSVALVRELRDQYIESLNPLGSVKFNPKHFIEFVCARVFPQCDERERHSTTNQLLRTYLDQQHFGSAVYAEVPAVLQELQSCCLLGTFSEGVRMWQLYKLRCTGLIKFFPHAAMRQIFPNKRVPEVIRQLPTDAIITDDNLLIIALLYMAKQAGQPIHPIWVNRINASTPEWLTGPQITSYEELPATIAQLQRRGMQSLTN